MLLLGQSSYHNAKLPRNKSKLMVHAHSFLSVIICQCTLSNYLNLHSLKKKKKDYFQMTHFDFDVCGMQHV